VRRGEIQCRFLGVDAVAYGDDGQPVSEGRGELVCRQPLPSMPVSFWQDPDGERYKDAYFNTFPGVWAHGDFIEFTEHGGAIIYGRSDATLNPGGVRIGTAEIYHVRKISGINQPQPDWLHILQGADRCTDIAGVERVSHDDADIVEHAEPHKRKRPAL
jgi:hypothetical protein